MIGSSLQRARSTGFHTRSATLQWGPREVTSLERTPRGQGAIRTIAGRRSKDGGLGPRRSRWGLEADALWPILPSPTYCSTLDTSFLVYKSSCFWFYRIMRINWKFYVKSTSPVLDWHLIGGYCL